jgi:hypothetical protein
VGSYESRLESLSAFHHIAATDMQATIDGSNKLLEAARVWIG